MGHWSERAARMVSNAANMEPSARLINIRKKSRDQTTDPGSRVTTCTVYTQIIQTDVGKTILSYSFLQVLPYTAKKGR